MRHRYNRFALGRGKQRHPLGVAPGDADVINPHADDLAAVGHHHRLVIVFHRERRHDLAVTVGGFDVQNPLAAAPGGAVFEGRCALAEAIFGDPQHEFFRLGHFAER